MGKCIQISCLDSLNVFKCTITIAAYKRMEMDMVENKEMTTTTKKLYIQSRHL